MTYGVAGTDGVGVGAAKIGSYISGGWEAMGNSSGGRINAILNANIGDPKYNPLIGTVGLTQSYGYNSNDGHWASLGARAGVELRHDRFMLGAHVGVDRAVSRPAQPWGAYAGIAAGIHF